MTYILITPKGKVYTFLLKSVADLYQTAYGGTLVDKMIMEDNYEQDEGSGNRSRLFV